MRVGLALGSGGLRGAAHIGVLMELERAGIHPDMVAGSSAGSIVATMYAAGLTVSEMEKIALGVTVRDIIDPAYSSLGLLALPLAVLLFGMRGRLPRGLIRGVKLEGLLRQVFGDVLMTELPMDCAVVSVDAANGDKVVFTTVPVRASRFKQTVYCDGKVVDAVRASCAIPGVFAWKDWQGRRLVDGAVREPVPARVLSEAQCDCIIAVDLGFTKEQAPDAMDLTTVIAQSLDILGEEVSDYVLHEYAHVVISPKVEGAIVTGFHRIPEYIEEGRRATRAAIPEIERALRRRGSRGRARWL